MSETKTKSFSAPLQSPVRLRGRAILTQPLGWVSLLHGQSQIAAHQSLASLSLRLEDGASLTIDLPADLSSALVASDDKKGLSILLQRLPSASLLESASPFWPLQWCHLRGCLIQDGDIIEVIGEVSQLSFSTGEVAFREKAEQHVTAVSASLLTSGEESSAKLDAALQQELPLRSSANLISGERAIICGRVVTEKPLGWISLTRKKQPVVELDVSGALSLAFDDQSSLDVEVPSIRAVLLSNEDRSAPARDLQSSPVVGLFPYPDATLESGSFHLRGACLRAGDIAYVSGAAHPSTNKTTQRAEAIATGIDAAYRVRAAKPEKTTQPRRLFWELPCLWIFLFLYWLQSFFFVGRFQLFSSLCCLVPSFLFWREIKHFQKRDAKAHVGLWLCFVPLFVAALSLLFLQSLDPALSTKETAGVVSGIVVSSLMVDYISLLLGPSAFFKHESMKLQFGHSRFTAPDLKRLHLVYWFGFAFSILRFFGLFLLA